MTGFWLLAALMVLLPLIILLRTLLFPGSRKYINEEPADMAVYKSRNEELESEVENEILSNKELPEIRDDLKRTLIYEMDNQTNEKSKVLHLPNKDWWTAAIITLLLPIAAFSIYQALGSPEINKLIRIHSAGENIESLESIEEMVEGLATRLQNEPEDTEGWFMLAKSYMILGNYNKAAGAFEHLYNLDDSHPDILLGYANALILANHGRTAGIPEQLAIKVLAMEPANSNGLWIVGMAAFERGDLQFAVDYWQQLLVQLEQGTETYKNIEELISRTEQQIITGSNQTSEIVPENLAVEDTNALSVNVTLSDHLIQDTNPSDTIFIFARALDGSPMPIAAVRKQVSDLPLSVVLDDSVAMMEQRKLSDFDKVIVGARISRSGNAMPQPGDLTGNTITVDMKQTDTVDILIDQKLP